MENFIFCAELTEKIFISSERLEEFQKKFQKICEL